MTTNNASYDASGADGGPPLDLRELWADPLGPVRGILLGILLGGALWIDALLLVRLLY